MSEPVDDEYKTHGGFPKLWQPVEPSPNYGPFVEAMRTLQDLAVSVDAPDDVLAKALGHAEAIKDLLTEHVVPEREGPAGRAISLPGRGSLLMLPWTIEKADADGVRSRGVFRRYHLGGNGAAHGGVLPLLFDELFGYVCFLSGRAISRTAHLHVNYRKITPLNVPLVVTGRVDRAEGRKTFITAELTDEDGTVLADAEGLMIKLHPWQP